MDEKSINNFHPYTGRLSKNDNNYFNVFKAKKSVFSGISFKPKRKSVMMPKLKKNNVYFPKNFVNQATLEDIEYFIFCIKYANMMLRKKYNCSKIVKNQLNKKEEILSVYDVHQIEYLIIKTKSRINCRLKEILIYNKRNEYLLNYFKQKESKKILRYLLYFIYDKDKITNAKRATEKIDKDKIKLKFENLIPLLDKKYKQINKINEETQIKDSFFEKTYTNIDNLDNKYKFVFNLSPFDIRNSIPSLHPNDLKILKYLKEYLRKKLCQKYFEQKYYYGNIIGNYDTNKINKSSKEEIKSKSKAINESFSKYIFKKKKYSSNNHNINRRIKNEVDIYDVEKLIKAFEGKIERIKTKQTKQIINKKDSSEKIIFSEKVKKKISFNISNINNNDKSTDKNYISQNSTTLSLRNRGNINKSFKLKKNRYFLINKISKKINSKKIFNMHYKKLYNTSIKNSENSFSFIKEEKKEKNMFQLKNSFLRKFLFNNAENNSQSRIIESYKKLRINDLNKPKKINYKFLKLKDFLKDAKATQYNQSKKPVKVFRSAKSFEYLNDLCVFVKSKNENIWEKGEDISTQIKCKELNQRLLMKLKMMNSKSLSNLKKCDSFRKMINYGDIYYNDFTLN